MAIIQDIPNEILENIISRLGGQDLLATSLVSHSFYAISQSPLYQQPCLYIDGANQLYDSMSILVTSGQSPMPGSVLLFLRTLLLADGRETFAQYVRTLTVDLDPPPRPKTPIPDIVLLTAAALNLGFNDHPLTKQRAQIVLILRLLPGLSSLELRDVALVGYYGHKLLKNLLMCPDAIPLGIRNLREFTCRGTYKSTGVTPQILVRLMGLPSIRKITVSITDDFYGIETFMETFTETFAAAAATAAGTSPVTKLIMYSRNITNESLELLLKIPMSLTYFCYTSEHGFSGHNIAEFWKALVPLESTLQYLKIYCLSYNEHQDRQRKIGTLRGWKALHTLSLQLFVLLGVRYASTPVGCLADLLPLGLHTLCVYSDSYWFGAKMVEQLIGVLQRGEIVVLRKLSVMIHGDDLTREMVQRLENACLMADVMLEWNQNGLY